MKAIGYTRCSTQEQHHSGLGLDAQRGRIRAYCTMQALDLVNIVTDAGVSGGKPLATREGGRQVLNAVTRRKADAVVILKLDRMFRSAPDCLATVDRWDKAGIALHIIDLGGNAIDTTSAAGRFMLVVLAGAAEMERNLVRERTRSALAVIWDHRLGRSPEREAFESDVAEVSPNWRGGPPRLDPDYIHRVCELIAKVARGIHAAHERGIVHRDVKPSNILIEPCGRPKIIDFGLAAMAWEPHVTVTGEFFGTPHYVSPEQARGKRGAIDRRTDVYSLGATLYECLTLSPPFEGDSVPDVLTKVINAAPRRPRQLI